MLESKKIAVWVINSFILIAVLALLATLYLTLASATIKISGEREKFSDSEVFTAADVPGGGVIPSTILSRDYQLTEIVQVSAKKVVVPKAGGIVSLVNNYIRDQNLVKTTRLLSPDDKLFRIVSAVVIPAGGTADVFVEADKPGDEYLIGPAKFTIPGLWEGVQDKIFGESKQSMSYERSAVAIITQDDVNAAIASTTDKIARQALTEFQRTSPNNAGLTLQQLTAKTIATSVDPAVGKEASQMKISVKQTVTAVLLKPSDLLKPSEDKLIAQLADKNSFIEMIADSISYTVTSVDVAAKTAQIEVKANAWIHSTKTTPQLNTKNLIGVSIARARAILASQGFDNAGITLFPSWAPTLPILKDHIKIEIK